jgi:hypothetical protein
MKLRPALYLAARLLGDVQAAAKGPGPLVKRRVRAKVYGKAAGQLSRAFRKVGL